MKKNNYCAIIYVISLKNIFMTNIHSKNWKWFLVTRIRQILPPAMADQIVLLGGKVIHNLIFPGETLSDTAKTYIQRTGTEIDISRDSQESIETFKEQWKWIIIMNHEAGTFWDYMPLFFLLWEDILRNSVFYTGKNILKMAKKEFPGYKFITSWYNTISEAKDLIQTQRELMTSIQEKWGYIFIIPAGLDAREEAPFQALFKRLVESWDMNLPLLISHGQGGMNYSEMMKNIGSSWPNRFHLQAEMTSLWGWKWQNGSEMKKYYNSFFE